MTVRLFSGTWRTRRRRSTSCARSCRTLPEGDTWISDPVGERFGLISFSEDDEPVAEARELIGKDPEIGEEFELIE